MPGRQYCFCHSQDPSEMAAGSSEESEKVHVAEGSCPRAQRSCAVLPGWVCVRAGTPRILSWHKGRCPETRFPSQTWADCESLCVKRITIFFFPNWFSCASPIALLFTFPHIQVVTELFSFAGFRSAEVWLLALWQPCSPCAVRMWFWRCLSSVSC